MEEQWISLREAAERLGVSVDTARRRLKRGELRGEQRTTPHGPSWFVLLPDEPSAAAHGDESATAHDLTGAALELAVLHERVAGLEMTLAQVQEERDRLVQGERELRALLHQQAVAFTLALPSSTQGTAQGNAYAGAEDAQGIASDDRQRQHEHVSAVAYDNTPPQTLWQTLRRRMGFA
jgi:hypothetical protein